MRASHRRPPAPAGGPRRAARAERLLGAICQAALRAPEAPALYATACRLLVEVGGYPLAWLGRLDPQTAQVQPAAQAGPATDLPQRLAAGLAGDAPAAALGRGERWVVNDLAGDPRAAAWRDVALALGHGACAAVPLLVGGRPHSALFVHAARPNHFHPAGLQVLDQIAADLALALGRLEQADQTQQAAAKRRESPALFRALFEVSPVAYTLARAADQVIVDINPAGERLFGYSRAEQIGRPITEIEVWADPHALRCALAIFQRDQQLPAFEMAVKTKAGVVRWAMVYASLVEQAGERYLLSEFVDITERVWAERQLAQMKRLYATLSQVNQVIVRLTDRPALFQAICDVAVQYGEFALAWIGLLDAATGDVQPVAAAGADLARWPFPIVNIAHGDLQNSLTASAVRTGQVTTSSDLDTDARTAGWRAEQAQRGYAALAVVPLRLRGQVLGTLALVSRQAGLFNAPDEMRLLNEIGLDVSFALDSLETTRERCAAEALQRQWADAFDHCAHGIAMALPANNTLLTGNPAYARLLGRAVADLPGLSILELYAPEERPRISQLLAEADRTGSVSYQAHKQRADGSSYPVQMDVVSVRDAAGELLYRVATQQDITARQEAAEAMQASERTLRLFVENAPAAIAMFDRDMRYLAASRRYLADYRLGDQELIGRSHYAVFPEIPERWKEIHRRCLAGAVEQAAEDPFPRDDGTLDWVRWEIHPWHEASGQIGGLILFSEVITELIESNQAMRESERRLRAVLSSLDDVLFEFDEHGTYLNVWTANEALLAQPRDQLLGRSINAVLGEAAGQPFTEAVQRVIHSGVSERIEYALEIDGEPRWFTAHINPILTREDGRRTASMLVRDLTARKQAEEAVRASEARYRALTESFESAIVTIDADGVFHFANPAAGAAFGVPPAALVGQTMSALFPPEVAEAQLRGVRTVIAEQRGTVTEAQTVIQGQPRWYRTSIQPIREASGEVRQALVNTVDITVRKQIEDQLRHSEARHSAILRAVPDVLLQVNREGTILDLSTSAGTLTGQPVADYLGRSLAHFLPPAVAAQALAGITEALTTKALARFEYELLLEGKPVYHEARLAPLTDDSVLAVVRDITQQRQAETDLQANAKRFRALIEHAPDGIALVGADGRLQFVSPSVQNLLGYAPATIGRDPRELTHPDDQPALLAQLAALMQQPGQTITATYRFQHANGAWRWVESRITNLLAEPEVAAIIFNFRDITDRVQAEQQIQRQLQRLQALQTIDRAITSSLDVRVTLNVLLDQVIAQLGADAATVLLANPQLQTLEHAASRGFAGRRIEHTVLRFGESWAGRAALERRSLFVADIAQSGSELARSQLITREGFVAYYNVPLIAKGQVIGVLELFQRRALELEPQWREFLETLAEQAAIAIDDAQLFAGLQRSNRELGLAYDATIQGWSRALDLRDHETEGHTMRVTELTLRLARAVGLSEPELTQVRYGCLLHDIGKLGIPDAILLKPGPLDEAEWAIMRRHPQYAYDMLAPIAYLQPALDIPYCHHERWDGAGYPRGLRGPQIPLVARLFAVVDVWDALRSDRRYRPAWPEDQALAYLRAQAGSHFDPAAVDLFMRSLGH